MKYYCFPWGGNWRHKRNWLITSGGRSTMDNRNFNLPNNQVRKRGMNSFKQSLINKQPFTPNSFQFFFKFILLQLSRQQNILGRKNIGGAFAPIAPSPHVTPMTEGLYIIYINLQLKTFKPFSTWRKAATNETCI